MATRALGRAGLPAAPLIQLPTLRRPQVVKDDGHELDGGELAALKRAFSINGSALQDVRREGESNDVETALSQTQEEEEEGDDHEGKEPVLSLADRNVKSLFIRMSES